MTGGMTGGRTVKCPHCTSDLGLNLRTTEVDVGVSFHVAVAFGLQVSHLYCPACERALCEDCVPEHEDHPRLTLDQGLEQQRSHLREKLSLVHNR